MSSSTDEFDKDRANYEVGNDKGESVIRMMQLTKGHWANEFSCIPEDSYEFAERSGYKFWQTSIDWLPDEPGGKSFHFKIASSDFCLSGSAAMPDEYSDGKKLRYIARSAFAID